MKITASSATPNRCYQSFDMPGRKLALVADGAVDHFVWDQVSLAQPGLNKEDWLGSVRDPRLQAVISSSFEDTPERSATELGPHWKGLDQSLFITGDPEGCHQQLQLGRMVGNGKEFSLTTVVRNAPAMAAAHHTIRGMTNMGSVRADKLTEEFLLL